MPTVKILTTNDWQLVATSSQVFIVDNISSYNVHVTFNSSAPSADAAYHILAPSEALLRMGLTGNVYVRDDSGDAGVSSVVVTT